MVPRAFGGVPRGEISRAVRDRSLRFRWLDDAVPDQEAEKDEGSEDRAERQTNEVRRVH